MTSRAAREDAEALLAKITPGEWTAAKCSHGGVLLRRGSWIGGGAQHPQHSVQIVPEADGEFIAAAPRLLRALLDSTRQQAEEIRTLRNIAVTQSEEIERLQAQVGFWEKRHETIEELLNRRDAAEAEVRQLHQENERLRGLLQVFSPSDPSPAPKAYVWHCRFHPTDWFHEVGCPHRTWTEEELKASERPT